MQEARPRFQRGDRISVFKRARPATFFKDGPEETESVSKIQVKMMSLGPEWLRTWKEGTHWKLLRLNELE